MTLSINRLGQSVYFSKKTINTNQNNQENNKNTLAVSSSLSNKSNMKTSFGRLFNYNEGSLIGDYDKNGNFVCYNDMLESQRSEFERKCIAGRAAEEEKRFRELNSELERLRVAANSQKKKKMELASQVDVLSSQVKNIRSLLATTTGILKTLVTDRTNYARIELGSALQKTLSTNDASYFNLCKKYHKNFLDFEFNHVSLDNKTFENIDFSNMNFENANFKNSKFLNTDFTNSNLKNANFENAEFENCIFSENNFEHTNLSGVKLKNTTIQDAIGLTDKQISSINASSRVNVNKIDINVVEKEMVDAILANDSEKFKALKNQYKDIIDSSIIIEIPPKDEDDNERISNMDFSGMSLYIGEDQVFENCDFTNSEILGSLVGNDFHTCTFHNTDFPRVPVSHEKFVWFNNCSVENCSFPNRERTCFKVNERYHYNEYFEHGWFDGTYDRLFNRKKG